MIAVFLLLALGFGGLTMQAGSDEHMETADIAAGLMLATAESYPAVVTLPTDCEHCALEGEALSASSCFVGGCIPALAEAKGPAPSGLALGTAYVLADQRLGGAADSPEPRPPRLTLLA